MTITSTADYQNAEDAAEAVGDVAAELNNAEENIEEGDFDTARSIIRSQIQELEGILEWLATNGGQVNGDD